MLVLQAVAAIGRRWPACHIFAALSGTLHFLGASNPSFRDFQQSSFVFRERLLGETLAFFRVSPVLRGVLHGTSPLVIFHCFANKSELLRFRFTFRRAPRNQALRLAFMHIAPR